MHIYIYVSITHMILVHMSELQPKISLRESSIWDIFIFGNWAGVWKTVILHTCQNLKSNIHSSNIDDLELYTKYLGPHICVPQWDGILAVGAVVCREMIGELMLDQWNEEKELSGLYGSYMLLYRNAAMTPGWRMSYTWTWRSDRQRSVVFFLEWFQHPWQT